MEPPVGLVANMQLWWNKSSKPLVDKIVFAHFFFWITYFIIFWSKAFWLDDQGNLIAGHVNLWGDWAAHFTMGSAMGYRELFLSSSPFIINATFSYPFLANLISATLIKLGLPFISAFVIPSFIFSVLLIFALYYFYKSTFKSKTVAILASLIFLLNGGMGFYYFGQDILQSNEVLNTIINPTHEYTRIDDQSIKWINVIDSMIIPQRAFNHGFPLALLALALITTLNKESDKKQRKLELVKIIIASIIIGLLPIIHTHSFLALAIILPFILLNQIRTTQNAKRTTINWILLLAVISIISLPIINHYFLGQVSHGFIQWYPGWLAKEYNVNWLIFWLKNWWLTPILAIVGLKFVNRKSKIESIPYFILFIAINLVLFQPFPWDNTKLLAWVSLGFSGLVANLIVKLWNRKINQKIIIVLLTISIIASGSIDAYRILRTDLHHYQMYSSEELELASWVKTNTDPHSIWLTANQHNNWLFNLTGRQTLMAYPGWLWTHGYNYRPIEQDVINMYNHPGENQELFHKYKVDYIVIGPQTDRLWGTDKNYFAENYTLIKRSDSYLIYKVKLDL